MRILHFPSNTGNHPLGLARAERALGHDSDVVVLGPSPFYGTTEVRSLDIDRLPALRRWFERLRFARQASGDYDVIHFNKGESFLPGSLPFVFDLWWLRRSGKHVIMTFQGSDARPHVAGAPKTAGVPVPIADAIRRIRVLQVRRWAHDIWCLNPDLLDHVPGARLLPYASVDIASIEPVYPQPHDGPLRLVHAPTNRTLKGTAAVERAVARAAEHVEIELDVVEGRPHAEVFERIRRADIGIDQLYSGWFGGFALECLAHGKPTIAMLDSKHRQADNPIIQADPESLTEVLIELVRARGSDLAQIGRDSRHWAEANHAPHNAAARVLAAVDGPAVGW